mmetsp:Transcript_71109/g.169741  ORF Transcript_71109/g.169741 Transcript_71109/m.169741 type:complete len:242 (+) Transcript_71109:765-1490(+)
MGHPDKRAYRIKAHSSSSLEMSNSVSLANWAAASPSRRDGMEHLYLRKTSSEISLPSTTKRPSMGKYSNRLASVPTVLGTMIGAPPNSWIKSRWYSPTKSTNLLLRSYLRATHRTRAGRSSGAGGEYMELQNSAASRAALVECTDVQGLKAWLGSFSGSPESLLCSSTMWWRVEMPVVNSKSFSVSASLSMCASGSALSAFAELRSVGLDWMRRVKVITGRESEMSQMLLLRENSKDLKKS